MLRAKYLITVLLLCGISTSLLAIDKDAGEIQIGPMSVYPGLVVSTRHDDNLFRSDTGEESTLISIVTPTVQFAWQDNIKKLTLDYGIEAGFHEDSSPDDYADHKLEGFFAYNSTDRIKTELRAEYRHEHDERGTERTEGGSGLLDPDEWHSWGVGGLVSYGTPNATGRVELEARYVDKEYDNNRLVTFVRDRSDLGLRGTFFYRIGPKTELLFEVKQTEFEYDATSVGTPTLDSTDRDYLVGVTWDATYKTTGVAKIGFNEKDFDSSLRSDAEDFTWEIGVKWMPRTYSTVEIFTERRQDETNGIGDSIDVAEIRALWNHEWRDRICSTVDFLYAEDDYNDLTSREDDRIEASLKLNYDWRRWARISAGYHYDERDSSTSVFDYKRNLFDITLNLTL